MMLKRNFYYSRNEYNNRFANESIDGFNDSRVDDPSLPQRIRNLIKNEYTKENKFLQSFLPSILEQFEKKGYLTQKQVDILEKNEKQFDPVNVKEKSEEHKQWAKEYDEEKRETAKKVAEYYRDQYDTGKNYQFYFEKTATKVLSDDDYIPSKKEYESMVNNKFAQQWLKNLSQRPKFKEGDYVSLNANANNYYNKRNYWKEVAILEKYGVAVVIEVKKPMYNRSGATIYNLLPMGGTELVDLEERLLKKAKGV